jgi:hypothetical protein
MNTQSEHQPSLAPLALSTLATAVIVGGSYYLTFGMGLKACPLCFYQRTFAMAAFATLLLALLTGAWRTGYAHIMALPSLLGGMVVAGIHVYLSDIANKLECPKGINDLGSAPVQSLTAFGVTLLIYLWGVRSDGKAGVGVILASAMLAGAMGYAGFAGSPPAAKPTAPYDPNQRIETCRVPYVAPN